jgi:hypothetical protein
MCWTSSKPFDRPANLGLALQFVCGEAAVGGEPKLLFEFGPAAVVLEDIAHARAAIGAALDDLLPGLVASLVVSR